MHRGLLGLNPGWNEANVLRVKTIEERIRELPGQLQREVEDFVEFLAQKRSPKAASQLRQDWAGALRDLSAQYTALDLQKKAMEWRGD